MLASSGGLICRASSSWTMVGCRVVNSLISSVDRDKDGEERGRSWRDDFGLAVGVVEVLSSRTPS